MSGADAGARGACKSSVTRLTFAGVNTNSTYDCIVIGAGQAGLAAGYYLQQAGKHFLLLDGHERIGDNWRQRWKGLRLFSPNQYNALPGMPPAGDPLSLPDRREMADYLEAYATHFALPVKNACTCVSAKKTDGLWKIETEQDTLITRQLILATGAYRTPFIPETLANSFPSVIRQWHSSEIQSVADHADADTSVLIIGAGASGQQLSHLFYGTGADVTLTGPVLPNLPRNFLGKDIYWWLYKSGMMTLRNDRPPGSWMGNAGKGDLTVAEPPLPDGVRRIKTKVTLHDDGHLQFDCQKTMPAPLAWPGRKKGIVVWCTGFRNTYPFLPADALDEQGTPLQQSGQSTVYNDLFFLGLPNLLRPNSSLVGGVGRDAERIVKLILQTKTAGN